MRLVLLSITSWLAGLLMMLLGFGFSQSDGASQLSSAGLGSLVTTALVFSLAYGPCLNWLKTRAGETPRTSLFPFASSIILNLPVFLIAMLAIGRTLLPVEAYAVMISFATMGATFGFGFVWSSLSRKRINEAVTPARIVTSKQALVGRAS